MPVYRRGDALRVVVWSGGRCHERIMACSKDDAIAFEDAWRAELGAKPRKVLAELDKPETPAKFFYLPGTATSHVYFVQSGDDGPIKIGFTRRKGLRLVALQNGSPVKLRMLCAIPGGRALERILHDRFAKHRMCGEWFSPTPRMLKLIDELCRCLVDASTTGGET